MRGGSCVAVGGLGTRQVVSVSHTKIHGRIMASHVRPRRGCEALKGVEVDATFAPEIAVSCVATVAVRRACASHVNKCLGCVTCHTVHTGTPRSDQRRHDSRHESELRRLHAPRAHTRAGENGRVHIRNYTGGIMIHASWHRFATIAPLLTDGAHDATPARVARRARHGLR